MPSKPAKRLKRMHPGIFYTSHKIIISVFHTTLIPRTCKFSMSSPSSSWPFEHTFRDVWSFTPWALSWELRRRLNAFGQNWWFRCWCSTRVILRCCDSDPLLRCASSWVAAAADCSSSSTSSWLMLNFVVDSRQWSCKWSNLSKLLLRWQIIITLSCSVAC